MEENSFNIVAPRDNVQIQDNTFQRGVFVVVIVDASSQAGASAHVLYTTDVGGRNRCRRETERPRHSEGRRGIKPEQRSGIGHRITGAVASQGNTFNNQPNKVRGTRHHARRLATRWTYVALLLSPQTQPRGPAPREALLLIGWMLARHKTTSFFFLAAL